MMYVPFPSLTEAERLARLPPIDWRQVRLGPDAAWPGAGLDVRPREIRLEM